MVNLKIRLFSLVVLFVILFSFGVVADSAVSEDGKLEIILSRTDPTPVEPDSFFDVYLQVGAVSRDDIDNDFEGLTVGVSSNYPLSLIHI